MPSPAALPKILCLHGSGTSGDIFHAQSARLRSLLRSRFEFVFPTASIPSSAGPGVVPFFEGPYYRWAHISWDEQGNHTQLFPLKDYENLQSFIQREGPFAGIMGFSQGASLAAALLQMYKFDFAILIAGVFPPIKIEEGDRTTCCHVHGMITPPPDEDCADEGIKLDDAIERISRARCITVHVSGFKDPWRKESIKLREWFNEIRRGDGVIGLDFDVGHQLPTKLEDLQMLAGKIVEVSESFECEQY